MLSQIVLSVSIFILLAAFVVGFLYLIFKYGEKAVGIMALCLAVLGLAWIAWKISGSLIAGG